MITPYDLGHFILFRYPKEDKINNIGIGIIQYIEIREEGNIYNVGFDIKEDQIIKSLGFKDDISIEVKKVSHSEYKWAEGKTLPLIDVSNINSPFKISHGTILVCSREDIEQDRKKMFPVSVYKLINELTGLEYYSKGYNGLELIK